MIPDTIKRSDTVPPSSVGSRYLAFKRLFDVVVASGLLLVLSPGFLLATILIKLESSGPVYYRGPRTGKDGRVFQIFKFRTMEFQRDFHGPLTTSMDDPRLTRLGEFLRRYKFDELPQLFDVIRGSMSLVGPRPDFPQNTDMYTDEERLILSVRPGITDFSSIKFRHLDQVVGDTDPDEAYFRLVWRKKMALRMFYVQRSSLTVDILILIRTARVMFGSQ